MIASPARADGLATSSSWRGRWLLAEDSETPPAELLSFLRLKHLAAADAFILEPVFMEALWSEHLQYPFSEDNERAALEDVAQRCDAALATFGGSVQEDLRALGEADRDSRTYKLAAVRYAERRALSAASRAVEAKLGTLSSLEYYQQRRLNSLGLQDIDSDEVDQLRAAGRVAAASSDYEW